MMRKPRVGNLHQLAVLCAWLLISLQQSAAAAEPVANWQSVIRQTPYWASQGMAENLATLRRWVLFSTGFCSVPQRHLLFDRRGRFLAFSADGETAAESIARINSLR